MYAARAQYPAWRDASSGKVSKCGRYTTRTEHRAAHDMGTVSHPAWYLCERTWLRLMRWKRPSESAESARAQSATEYWRLNSERVLQCSPARFGTRTEDQRAALPIRRYACGDQHQDHQACAQPCMPATVVAAGLPQRGGIGLRPIAEARRRMGLSRIGRSVRPLVRVITHVGARTQGEGRAWPRTWSCRRLPTRFAG